MTSIEEKIQIMQAFRDGKAIESRRMPNFEEGLSEGDWGDDALPTWNWSRRDYRVKPVEAV